jgi:ribose transport system permease protein
VLVGVAIVGIFVLRKTVFGSEVYAMGGSREASRLVGIPNDLISCVVYMVCGLLAALAGVILASELLAGSGTLGTDLALSSVTAVILGGAALTGGTGGIEGTMLGVLVLGTVSNGLALIQVSAFYQQIVTGSLLIIAVALGRLRSSSFRRWRKGGRERSIARMETALPIREGDS